MSKILYSLKMDMSSEGIGMLGKGQILGAQQKEKIQKFVLFIIFCYLPWWSRSANAASAPLNHLKLLREMRMYKSVDIGVANAAFSAFENHLWYITEELVPLAFYSSHVTVEEKKAMVSVLKN